MGGSFSIPEAWRDASRCCLATVQGDGADELLSRWPSDLAEPKVLRSFEDVPLPLAESVEVPESVGVDRLLNVLGWIATTGEPTVITVDFGTAITIDWGRDGAFGGGLILPGPALMVRALASGTDRLPEIEATWDPRASGGETVSAIRRGVSALVSGGVEQAVVALRAQLGEATPIVSTGGGSAHWSPAVPSIERVMPHLTLDGVVAALELSSS